MICPNCGKENEENNKFCISCGTDLNSKETAKSNREQIEFHGRMTPSPAFLEGERVLSEFRASFWDLGLMGYILRYKERIVITTHRIFQFSQRVTGESLNCLLLRKIESIEIGSKFNIRQFLIGITLLMFGIFAMHESSYGYDMPWYIRLLVIAIAIVLLLTAKRKILRVTASDVKNLIALPFIRMKKEDAKRFIDLISKSTEDLNSSKKV